MIDTFKALVLTQDQGKTEHHIRQLSVDDLPDGDILVAVNLASTTKTAWRSSGSCLQVLWETSPSIRRSCWPDGLKGGWLSMSRSDVCLEAFDQQRIATAQPPGAV